MTDPFPFDNAVDLLDADHKLVESMFLEYDALCEEGASDEVRQTLAERICREIAIHAQIEEEIFYPAAREASIRDGEDLLDEAEVEHGSLKQLVAAIESNSPESDELFDARVKVLGEYVKHHVKEEENELFPRARKSDMDLEEVGARLAARKDELMRGLKGDA